MIVCDESSKIKNPTTAQSKALHKLGKKTKFNVILTGTPVTNNPLDFFSQYKFLNEEILGPSYYLFRNRYAVMGGYQNHQIVGYNHLPDLVEKVHKIAFRIKIQDAVDLPPFIDEPCEHDYLFVFFHATIDNIFESLYLCRTYCLRLGGCIVTDKPARTLRQS